MIECNNILCKHNKDGKCTLDSIYIHTYYQPTDDDRIVPRCESFVLRDDITRFILELKKRGIEPEIGKHLVHKWVIRFMENGIEKVYAIEKDRITLLKERKYR